MGRIENEKDLGDDVSARIYEFASDMTGFEWDNNQDDPSLFRKTQEYQNFELNPICDGECQGKKYNPDSKENVATIVLYCNAPSNSGYRIHFSKAQVNVVPKSGMALAYSYVATDFTTDFGFTEYTECPAKNHQEIIGIKYALRPYFDFGED